DGGRVHHVERPAREPGARPPSRLLEGRPFLGDEPGHGDRGAVAEESKHDGPAKGPRAPGDHGDLARHERGPASASIRAARSKSRVVSPPASWVLRSTTTRFQTLDHSG